MKKLSNVLVIAAMLPLPLHIQELRPHLCPGDSVLFDCDGIGGDVPLTMPHPGVALELEAFTGRSNMETTGWIRKGQFCLVVAVVDSYVFILGRPGNGWGWIDNMFLVKLLDYSQACEMEVAEARHQAALKHFWG